MRRRGYRGRRRFSRGRVRRRGTRRIRRGIPMRNRIGMRF